MLLFFPNRKNCSGYEDGDYKSALFRITENGAVSPHISTQKPKKTKQRVERKLLLEKSEVVGSFHMTSSPPC